MLYGFFNNPFIRVLINQPIYSNWNATKVLIIADFSLSIVDGRNPTFSTQGSSWLVHLPLTYSPQKNKGFVTGLIKGNLMVFHKA